MLATRRDEDPIWEEMASATYRGRLGGDRLEQIAARQGATISYRPVRLAEIYATTGGILLQQRSQQRQAYREVELGRW